MERGTTTMITYTLNIAQYIILIALSVSTGYILDEIVRAIKNGDFFDWEQKKKPIQLVAE